jgi:hypothetical protein
MTSNVYIILKESDALIQKKINAALSKELNNSLNKSLKRIQQAVKSIVRSAIDSSPEIASLRGGTLKLDFGLVGDHTMDIVNAISNSVFVTMKPVKLAGNSISGGISVAIQPDDYSLLLSLPASRQLTERGVSLPWLDWLLNLGDTLIIADFGVQYGPYGRTGGAHMISKNRPYKVDTRYSGTASDNFITRALSRSHKQIGEAIVTSIRSA